MVFELNNDLHFLLNSNILNVLFRNRIRNVYEFMERDNNELMNFTNFDYAQIVDIKDKILDRTVECQSAKSLLETTKLTTAVIPTLFSKLDELVDGGLRSRCVYEICGYSGSGKSWFCRQLIVRFAKNFRQKVLLIDTTNCWANEDYLQLKSTVAENNVDFLTLLHEEDLIQFLLQLKQGFTDKIYNYRLIVIDSLAALYRKNLTDPDGFESLSNLSKIASLMKFLANEFNLIVIYVNLMCKRFVRKVWIRIANIPLFLAAIK